MYTHAWLRLSYFSKGRIHFKSIQVYLCQLNPVYWPFGHLRYHLFSENNKEIMEGKTPYIASYVKIWCSCQWPLITSFSFSWRLGTQRPSGGQLHDLVGSQFTLFLVSRSPLLWDLMWMQVIVPGGPAGQVPPPCRLSEHMIYWA